METALPQSPETAASDSEKLASGTRTMRRAALVCGFTLVLLGFLVLLGWLLRIEVLLAIFPGHIRMKSNAAAAFIAAGIALSTTSWQSPFTKRISLACATLTVSFGLLTLGEYVFHRDLHIDQLLFTDPMQKQYPGRMAHITAFNFCLAGLSLLALHGGRHARRFSQAAALLLTGGAIFAITGYLYGVPVLYGSLLYTAMAFHTGVGFLVLGAGLLLAQPHSRLMQVLFAPAAGGWLARRALPGVVLLPVLLGWLFLRPVINFHRPRFGMALFALTLVAAGAAALWSTALLLNRREEERAALTREREHAAIAIRQSERELRLVTDRLPVLLSYIDPDERFLRVNRTYETWSGQPAEQIVGSTIRALLGERYWQSTTAARQHALRGETITVEALYPTIRGERRVEITYAPDTDGDGLVRGLVCMAVDVENQRQAEAALRQSEKLAVVGRLASSIAHEINNPLEAVTNLLYLAGESTGDAPTLAHYLTEAQAQLARVTEIVVQTLRFHRQSTEPTPCRLAEVIEQVLVLYSGRLAGAGIAAEARFREKRPLLCREGELRQVIANLVGNAADAMGSGGRLLLRTRGGVHPRSGQPGAIVTVADTGHGISAAAKQRLFHPFHTTKGETGSGLGLWISKEIIDRHGGLLHVRSSTRPGAHGTVFRIFVPHVT